MRTSGGSLRSRRSSPRSRIRGPRARCIRGPRTRRGRSTRASAWPARIPARARRRPRAASPKLAVPRGRDTRGRFLSFRIGRLSVGYRNATQAFIRREPSFAVMGSARPAALAVIAFLLIFWSVFTPAVGQNPAGHMLVSTDYELFGTSDLNGGGHVTWTLTGAKAADLRARIVDMFDTYGQIPRGFPFAGPAGAANADGTLQPLEGVRYTDQLENVLEDSGRGTIVQYMQLLRFDLRENAADSSVGFERSTSGLANTNASSPGDVEIRFLFEANTTTRSARVSLPTAAFAEALYRGFHYEAVQSPSI